MTAASAGESNRRQHLRRAEPSEAKDLEELQDRSASHWNYPDGLLLDKMFLDVDEIGRGLGRVLWEHAVHTARELGVSEFIIGADPNAAPFYKSMGARWYASSPTEEPTWTVQMYRFTLPG